MDKASLLPRFAQVRRQLRQLVLTGELQPGDRLPGERELARRFQVSQMTVNRALQELEREGLLRREVGRGTFVCDPQEQEQPNRQVDLVFPYPVNLASSYYHGALFQGIRQAATTCHCRFSLVEVVGEDYHALLAAPETAGLLLFNPGEEHREELMRLHEQHAPVLVLGASWPETGIPCVDSDNVGGARQAVGHLIELGHARIGIVNGDVAMTNSRDRLQGYRQGLREAGLRLRKEWVVSVPGDMLDTAGIERLRGLLESVRRPTAIFAAGYFLAAQTMQVAKEASLRVPEELSVVGFDNPISAAYLDPPLTTVEQPLHEMGRQALIRLIDTIEGREGAFPEEILPTRLIRRQSTASPALVAQATTG